jgi:hypothetical protein
MIGITVAPLMQCVVIEKLNDVGDGYVTATVTVPCPWKRDGMTTAQAGDVMSCQPDGKVETRAAGTTGAWEKARVSGSIIIFVPEPGKAWAFGFVKA